MKLSQVVQGNFKNKEVVDGCQEWLRRIDIINKMTPEGSDVKLEHIEKLIHSLSHKYKYQLQWLSVSYLKDRGEEPNYSLSVKRSDTHEWVGTVYGLTLYETFAKMLLFIYANIKKEQKDGH